MAHRSFDGDLPASKFRTRKSIIMATIAESSARPATASRDNAVEKEALAWMDDPVAYFGGSPTKMHSVSRDHADAVQLAALNIRLEQRRQQIKVLEKLADAQGISRLRTLDDAAPILLKHDVYKSYPASLLAKRRFDQLSVWLSRLTPHDLSNVDVSKCETIDDWLDKLFEETPVDVTASSGTSGTMSFFPKSKHDHTQTALGMRAQLVTPFGKEPTDADRNDKFHVITPLPRDGHASTGSAAKYLRQVFCKGDDTYFHPCFDYKVSTDLLWLAGRLRAAAAKGDVSKVDVSPALLARRAELEAQQKDMPAQQIAFILRMAEELRGKRVLALGMTVHFWSVVKSAMEGGVKQGVGGAFGPGSLLSCGGGLKGAVVPDNVDELISNFFGVDRIHGSYGSSEVTSLALECEHGRYHLVPWLTPYLLDVESGQPLPRNGVQTGRGAFFDMTHDGTWGGLITGDLLTIDWDMHCPCGRKTIAIEKKVQRLSELQGGSDKISCAAQPAALAEAMDFLTGLEG
jgi:hypothetical protein